MYKLNKNFISLSLKQERKTLPDEIVASLIFMLAPDVGTVEKPSLIPISSLVLLEFSPGEIVIDVAVNIVVTSTV